MQEIVAPVFYFGVYPGHPNFLLNSPSGPLLAAGQNPLGSG